AAVEWLTANNHLHRHYRALRQDALAGGETYIRTARCLLHLGGIEVAARPHLHPRPAFADTGIKKRLQEGGWEAGTPPVKRSIMRKLSCRVADYYMGMIGAADKTEQPPDNFTVANHTFESYWRNQASVLVDRARQRGLPTLFPTRTVAEWKFPLLSAVFARYKKAGRLTDIQGPLTMHAYHVIRKVLDDFLRSECVPAYFKRLHDYSLRVEFQGRGTLHAHLVGWVGWYILAGRTDAEHCSPLARRLDEIFAGRVDVACGQGMDEALLNHVTRYAAKASVSLSWRASGHGDIEDSQWLRTYRMLTKRALTGPEMIIDLATAPLMMHTYEQSATHAQAPDSRSGFGPLGRLDNDAEKSRPIPDTAHRKFHDLYLDREGQGGRLPPDAAGFQESFADFARMHRYDPAKHRAAQRFQGTRAQACFGKVSCSVGFSFSWGARDNFAGQFMATFVPRDKANDWELREELPGRGEPPRPENTRFLTAALRSACRDGGAVRSSLQRWIREEDARLAEYVDFAQSCEERGKPSNRKASTDAFKSFAFQSAQARGAQLVQGCGPVAKERTAVREWLVSGRAVSFDAPEDREIAFLAADAAFDLIKTGWNLQRPHHLLPRAWPPGQAEHLRVARAALSVEDSHELRLAPVLSRFAHVSGEPGRGKSEAIIYAAHEASQREARVPAACPTGVLVGQYRDRLPSTQFVTVETIHSERRVSRDYDPGGQRGIRPTFPVQHIHMETHEFARSKDPVLLDFLSDIQARQPIRRALKDFFGERHLGRNLPRAVAERRRVSQEAAPGDRDPVTWLTRTNEGTQKVNCEYLRQSHDLEQASIDAHPGAFRSDPDYGERKTDFCNGATGTVAFVLSDWTSGPPVFIVRLSHGVYVLVHPIKTEQGLRCTAAHIPAVYGYGMTTRQAQGATLRRVALHSELRRPACRGFAHVGLSRVSRRDGAFYFGRHRRTDWLPAGGPGAPAEQVERGVDSTDDSDLSDEEAGSVAHGLALRRVGVARAGAPGDSDADGGLALLGGQGAGTAADYGALFGGDSASDTPGADAESGSGQGGGSDSEDGALFG
ncbi:unnamed protein product, partial [Prorocentrum cordatum]